VLKTIAPVAISATVVPRTFRPDGDRSFFPSRGVDMSCASLTFDDSEVPRRIFSGHEPR